ncbi:hypothetical protein NECAME_07251, partial [Necator americanus]
APSFLLLSNTRLWNERDVHTSLIRNPKKIFFNFIPCFSSWAFKLLFSTTLLQLCGTVHPGMAIDHDAVLHIKDLITQIVNEILDQKSVSVVDMDKAARRLFPVSCHWITRDAWDAMYNHTASSRKFHPGRFGGSRLPHDLHHKMSSIIKDNLGREKDKKDREKDKEIDKMSYYLIAICEGISEVELFETYHSVSLFNCVFKGYYEMDGKLCEEYT